MDTQNVLSLLQTISIIATLLVAVGTLRGRDKDKTVAMTEMQMDIKYIKQQVEGFDVLRDRISSVEQSSKSAHKRIDEHLKYDHNKHIEARE